ncbi:LysR family transcriptional regulator [Aquincola sp. S2]|uniref:LysR family transcriptional regulator n=1 Tax=Pseudaquabacterium terrae TaxID=2732868 RepID=A0ABX2E921_9BURK|nr:LysR substrate-binding domain-containing protein [Aquabacterium terrae]NRF65391.1 LysR family transcriptional regulator [Aquabacterium terrae]
MSTRPPLNALHVFCAVARHGGVRLAAQQLCVTPGAVSRQIQALEAHLGQALFERGPGATQLTAAGRRLHQRVGDKMEAITDALSGAGAAGRRRSIVRVETGVTLAMHWLIPRLRGFAERHPQIDVQVGTTDGDVDPASRADVFIRRDHAELRGLVPQRFLAERSVLVASATHPAAALARPGARQLARWPRIGARSRPDLWPQWAAFHGLGVNAWEPTLEFDNTVLAIQATAEGLGLCVLPELFIAGLLETGALRCVQAQRVDTGAYAYAIGPRRDSARVAAFTDWLRGPAIA